MELTQMSEELFSKGELIKRMAKKLNIKEEEIYKIPLGDIVAVSLGVIAEEINAIRKELKRKI